MSASEDAIDVWGKPAVIHAGKRNNNILIYVSLLAVVKTGMSRYVHCAGLAVKQTGNPTIQVADHAGEIAPHICSVGNNWCWIRTESGKTDPHRKETELRLNQSLPFQAGNISLQANVFLCWYRTVQIMLPVPFLTPAIAKHWTTWAMVHFSPLTWQLMSLVPRMTLTVECRALQSFKTFWQAGAKSESAVLEMGRPISPLETEAAGHGR